MGPNRQILNYESGSGSGSGSFLFIKDLKKMRKKVQYFIILNDLLRYRYLFDKKIFIGNTNVQVESGTGPTSGWIFLIRIRFHNSGLRIRIRKKYLRIHNTGTLGVSLTSMGGTD
jgi:hypothetical protein